MERGCHPKVTLKGHMRATRHSSGELDIIQTDTHLHFKELDYLKEGQMYLPFDLFSLLIGWFHYFYIYIFGFIKYHNNKKNSI